MQKNLKKIAIVGSGLGGMSTAIRLAKKGYDVTVYEQNGSFGGKVGELIINTLEGPFRFDTGPSLLTLSGVFEDLFGLFELNFQQLCPLNKLESSCKYFWSDGLVFNSYKNLEKLQFEIERLGISNRKELEEYKQITLLIWEKSKDFFVYNDLNVFSFFDINFLLALPYFWKINFWRTMHDFHRKIFRNPKMVQVFDRYATFNGSNPYLTPATFSVISQVDLFQDTYLPENGVRDIVLQIYNLALMAGVNFRFNCHVDKVNKVEIQGKNQFEIVWHEESKVYDSVVFNVDPLTVQKKKIVPFYKEINLNTKELSSSAIVFYWAINAEFPELDLHNILFTDDYFEEFNAIFENCVTYTDPTIYINITKKKIITDAPKGCENWFVMINTPPGSDITTNQIEKLRRLIITKIENFFRFANLDNLIIGERVLTRKDLELKTGSYMGSLYGKNSNKLSSAFMRNLGYKVDEGIFFVGGSVHPGGGMPLAVLSGKFVAEKVNRLLTTY
jgi:phytoene desaturase